MLLLSIPLTIVTVLVLDQYVAEMNMLTALVVMITWIIILMAIESVCDLWRRRTP